MRWSWQPQVHWVFFRLVTNYGAWKLLWQRRTLWFLAHLFWGRIRLECRQLSVDSLRSSSKLPCTVLICSLRLANLCRLKIAISWIICSMMV